MRRFTSVNDTEELMIPKPKGGRGDKEKNNKKIGQKKKSVEELKER